MAFSSVAICASTAATRARAASISWGRAPARVRAGSRGSGLLPQRGEALLRDVPPGLRVVARLARSRVDAQQRLVALQVGLSAGELRFSRGDLGLRSRGLCGRLPDVFGPRPCLQQAELGVGLGALCARTRKRQFRVAGVQTRDNLPRRQAVSLLDVHLDDTSFNFGRQLDVVGLDVARHAHLVGRRLGTAP